MGSRVKEVGMRDMKVGDTVMHREDRSLGRGKIVSFRTFHGTVLVKWHQTNALRYHVARTLRVYKTGKK